MLWELDKQIQGEKLFEIEGTFGVTRVYLTEQYDV